MPLVCWFDYGFGMLRVQSLIDFSIFTVCLLYFVLLVFEAVTKLIINPELAAWEIFMAFILWVKVLCVDVDYFFQAALYRFIKLKIIVVSVFLLIIFLFKIIWVKIITVVIRIAPFKVHVFELSIEVVCSCASYSSFITLITGLSSWLLWRNLRHSSLIECCSLHLTLWELKQTCLAWLSWNLKPSVVLGVWLHGVDVEVNRANASLCIESLTSHWSFVVHHESRGCIWSLVDIECTWLCWMLSWDGKPIWTSTPVVDHKLTTRCWTWADLELFTSCTAIIHHKLAWCVWAWVNHELLLLIRLGNCKPIRSSRTIIGFKFSKPRASCPFKASGFFATHWYVLRLLEVVFLLLVYKVVLLLRNLRSLIHVIWVTALLLLLLLRKPIIVSIWSLHLRLILERAIEIVLVVGLAMYLLLLRLLVAVELWPWLLLLHVHNCLVGALCHACNARLNRIPICIELVILPLLGSCVVLDVLGGCCRHHIELFLCFDIFH